MFKVAMKDILNTHNVPRWSSRHRNVILKNPIVLPSVRHCFSWHSPSSNISSHHLSSHHLATPPLLLTPPITHVIFGHSSITLKKNCFCCTLAPLPSLLTPPLPPPFVSIVHSLPQINFFFPFHLDNALFLPNPLAPFFGIHHPLLTSITHPLPHKKKFHHTLMPCYYSDTPQHSLS